MTYIRIVAFGFPREFDNTDEGRERVYDAILELAESEELAIEVCSWCELATVGETFESEQFTVEIFSEYED